MYQCCAEFSSDRETAKAAASQQIFQYPWEVLFDAELELRESSGGSESADVKQQVNCLFTRVYIDDDDLLQRVEVTEASSHTALINGGRSQESGLETSMSNLALAPGEQELQQTSTTESLSWETSGKMGSDWKAADDWHSPSQLRVPETATSSAQSKLKKEESSHGGEEAVPALDEPSELDGAEEAREEMRLKEEGADRFKRRKKCQTFAKKISDFQFVPDFHIDAPANAESSESSQKQLLLDDVHFKAYPDTIYNHQRKKKRKMAKMSFSLPSMASSSKEEQGEGVPRADQREEEGTDQLSIEQKLQFRFGYEPNRDRGLMAKLARHYFAKDKEMDKYLAQRHRYFSRLDRGVLLDRESWFSVTPERIAMHVADRLVRIRDCTILDAFTGAGGNAIQFALRGALVFAVDIDPVKLRCALQNAKIYESRQRIDFVCGDFFHIARAMLGAREAKERGQALNTQSSTSKDSYPFGIDVAYLSPPWGGPSYREASEVFDLRHDLAGMDGFRMFKIARHLTPNIVLFLPKNTSARQLAELAGSGGEVELEQCMLNGKLKALHAYYGQLVAKE